MTIRGVSLAVAAAVLAGVTPCAFAADAAATGVALRTAWMRPAAAGTTEEKAYVDIVNESGGDLELVGASTSLAKRVELVQVTQKGDAREQKVVATMPVPAGRTTRLAYNGSHLRLVEITKDLGNGSVVPLSLAFRSPDGREASATVNVQVRGLLLPGQMPAPPK